MTENKNTVMRYMDGFVASDHEMILGCLTDDVVWYMPGFFHLTGKTAFDKEIENDAFEGKPAISISRMTEENDVVIAEGTVQSKIKAGGMLDALFCDVFEMENGKIKQLTTYLMHKKKTCIIFIQGFKISISCYDHHDHDRDYRSHRDHRNPYHNGPFFFP
ncbi:MAG TPA: nuclear transport factor 2 family protein [Chitinophagaceae bacterium]